ncbi:MAG TPA: hypothetical protein V6C58_04735 [Allocoleopsis sp.]
MAWDDDVSNLIAHATGRISSAEERGQLRKNNLETQKQIEGLLAAQKAGYVNDAQFQSEMQKLGLTAKDLDQYQRNYQDTQTQNRGTAGENPLISNLISNATNRQQWQQQAGDALASELAANPLRQYNLDTDLKREMAFQNQKNLANNVTNQLTALSNARSTNADMIKTAMQGGGAGLSNTSFGMGR